MSAFLWGVPAVLGGSLLFRGVFIFTVMAKKNAKTVSSPSSLGVHSNSRGALLARCQELRAAPTQPVTEMKLHSLQNNISNRLLPCLHSYPHLFFSPAPNKCTVIIQRQPWETFWALSYLTSIIGNCGAACVFFFFLNSGFLLRLSRLRVSRVFPSDLSSSCRDGRAAAAAAATTNLSFFKAWHSFLICNLAGRVKLNRI